MRKVLLTSFKLQERWSETRSYVVKWKTVIYKLNLLMESEFQDIVPLELLNCTNFVMSSIIADYTIGMASLKERNLYPLCYPRVASETIASCVHQLSPKDHFIILDGILRNSNCH